MIIFVSTKINNYLAGLKIRITAYLYLYMKRDEIPISTFVPSGFNHLIIKRLEPLGVI